MVLSHDQLAAARELLVSATEGQISGADRDLLHAYLRDKASLGEAEVNARVGAGVEIVRDDRGVPHIFATHADDLWFAIGYVQGQDRLWQLDYLRRQAHGRLSEVFGRETLDGDILSRTLNISGIARAAYDTASPASRVALDAFAAGVNAWMERLPAGLPVEFEILGYEPEPWTAIDSLAVLRRWWWYLTGRLNVITTPEVVRAATGTGGLYDAFFSPDGPVTYIVPSGSYETEPRWPGRPMDAPSAGFGSSSIPAGSNNWAAAPSATQDGSALLASDPHVYFSVPADWYEVHFQAGETEAFGVCYPAMPGVLIGRNRHVAWGVTNNICSLRDLFMEELDESGANYRSGDTWIPIESVTDVIQIKGAAPHSHVTRFAHGRPIVDHLVPAAAHPARLWPRSGHEHTALSLAWVGFEPSDELATAIALSRARTVAEAREAYRGWRCPTFNMVLADDAGNIGYQTIGAIPLRGRDLRGYRSANEPADAWQGTIPFDGLPKLDNPERGFISSANNPTAPSDFPYPLSGTWAPEDRAGRAEHLLLTQKPHSMDGFERLQMDIHSGRAERGVPGLLASLEGLTGEHVEEARAALASWDFAMSPEAVAPAIYYVFHWRWHRRVVAERFTETLQPLAIDSGWGLTAELLYGNLAGWFASDEQRLAGIRAAFEEALAYLRDRLGSDPAGWEWGKLHRLGAVHPAARTPLQHELLDIPYQPHMGGASTLAAAFHNPPGSFDTRLGANYRLLAELGPGLDTRSVCWPGQSGNPGSPHYADQVAAHLSGNYVTVSFDPDAVRASATSVIRLVP